MKAFIVSFIIFVLLTLIINVALEIFIVAFTGSRGNVLVIQIISLMTSSTITSIYLIKLRKNLSGKKGSLEYLKDEWNKLKEEDQKEKIELTNKEKNNKEFRYVFIGSIIFGILFALFFNLDIIYLLLIPLLSLTLYFIRRKFKCTLFG